MFARRGAGREQCGLNAPGGDKVEGHDRGDEANEVEELTVSDVKGDKNAQQCVSTPSPPLQSERMRISVANSATIASENILEDLPSYHDNVVTGAEARSIRASYDARQGPVRIGI